MTAANLDAAPTAKKTAGLVARCCRDFAAITDMIDVDFRGAADSHGDFGKSGRPGHRMRS